MASKNKMLQEAIADCNVIKELAIENAKRTLTETFQPTLLNLVSQKLSEEADEDEDNTDEIEETIDMDEAKKKKAAPAEEDEEPAEDEDEMDESIDIDAILAEIDDSDEDEVEVDEAKKKKAAPAEEDEEPAEDEDDLDEDIDLNQLLGELSETKEKDPEEDEEAEDMDEADEKVKTDDPKFLAKLKTVAGDKYQAILKFFKDEISPSSVKPGGKYADNPSKLPSSFEENAELEEVKQELYEVKKQFIQTAKKMNETNLINAKLIYMTKILESGNFDNKQKVKVVAAFDKAKNVKDAKLVFETLSEALKPKTVKKTTIKESKSIPSKVLGTSGKKEIIAEGTVYNRWQELAGLNR